MHTSLIRIPSFNYEALKCPICNSLRIKKQHCDISAGHYLHCIDLGILLANTNIATGFMELAKQIHDDLKFSAIVGIDSEGKKLSDLVHSAIGSPGIPVTTATSINRLHLSFSFTKEGAEEALRNKRVLIVTDLIITQNAINSLSLKLAEIPVHSVAVLSLASIVNE